MNPGTVRQINTAVRLLRLPDGSDKDVRTEEIFKLFGQAARVVLVVQEERPLNGEAGVGVLLYQRFQQLIQQHKEFSF